MRLAALLALLAGPTLLADPASAHVGHLGDLAGHDHWVAGAALGAAVLAGLWGAWKGRAAPKPAKDEAEGEAGA